MPITQALTSLDADPTGRRDFLCPVAPATAWLVKSGTVQLFALRHRGGRAPQALRPLFQVSAGQAGLGVPEADRFGITLVARRMQNGAVDTVPRDLLGEIGFQCLDSWIVELSRRVVGERTAHIAQVLEQGQQLCTDDHPLSASCKGVVWVRQVAGHSHFLGRPDLPIPEGALFPLSHTSFVTVEPHGTLVVADRLACDGADIWNGVDLFHAHVCQCLAQALDADDDAARQRSRARERALKQAVSVALRDLASPLRRSADDDPVLHPEAWESPLLRACQRIGVHLGIQMKPHPDLARDPSPKSQVSAIARMSGVRYRRVALRDQWWRHSSEPLLAFRAADERPVALIPRVSRQGYRVFDPVAGTTAPLDTATVKALRRFAYMFYRPLPAGPLTARDLLAFGLRGRLREVQLIVGLSLAAGLLALATPIATGLLFESVVPNGERSELLSWALMLVVAAVAAALLSMARGLAVLRLQGELSLALEAGLWDRLLALPLTFFRDYAAGDLAERSLAFSHIRRVLTASTLNALLSGLFSLTSLGLLLYYSPSLALVAIAMTIVALLVSASAAHFTLKFQRQISAISGRLMGDVVAFITAIAKLRQTCSERRAFALWARQFASEKRTDVAARRVTTMTTVFSSVFLPACLGALFYVHAASRHDTTGALSTADFLAFVTAFGQFMAAVLRMGTTAVTVAGVLPVYERASPIFLATPESRKTDELSSEILGGVEAHHVTFRYRADAPLVLRGVSFRIQPGEFVAFAGPSGCGKSTLLRLLLGFERPESGALHYDGKDLSQFDIEGLRRQIGVVLQNEILLAGTIKDNICGAAAVPLDEVWQAARLAALDEDIRNMPLGMHTKITECGGGLSGGQRQRVLIARAVLGRPRLLLFDEATSALDNRTQATIGRHLTTLAATRIVIAHRLSTVVDADRIFVMESGQIVQAGTYGELVRQPGVFRRLAERQML